VILCFFILLCFYCCVFVGVKTSTYKYDAFFFSKLRLALFDRLHSVLPGFTKVGIDFERNIEWVEQTVTLIVFYCFNVLCMF